MEYGIGEEGRGNSYSNFRLPYSIFSIFPPPMLRVAINGFGRIGRTILKVGWNRKDIEFVGINDLTDPHTLAHFLKKKSVFFSSNLYISFF